MSIRAILSGFAVAAAMTAGTPLAGAAEKSGAAELTVVVKDLRSDEGLVKIALWQGAKGFTDPEAALAKLTVVPAGKQALVTISDLAPGAYALAIYHDENGNDKFDKTWIGWPDEGLGFSNGAWIKLGPPSFKDAAIKLEGGAKTTEIFLRY